MHRTVKDVAVRVGLPSRTIRYYDRIGLVRSSQRSESGYRLYGAEEEGKLRFVRQAKALGFSLDDIRGLIAAAELRAAAAARSSLNSIACSTRRSSRSTLRSSS